MKYAGDKPAEVLRDSTRDRGTVVDDEVLQQSTVVLQQLLGTDTKK